MCSSHIWCRRSGTLAARLSLILLGADESQYYITRLAHAQGTSNENRGPSLSCSDSLDLAHIKHGQAVRAPQKYEGLYFLKRQN